MYINILRKFPQTNYSIDLCFSIFDYVVSWGVPRSRTRPLLCSCVSSLSFWWFGWVASPPSPSDGLEELEPSPSNSPVTSRAAIGDLVQLVSLLNCDKNYKFIIYLIIIHSIVRKWISGVMPPKWPLSVVCIPSIIMMLKEEMLPIKNSRMAKFEINW